MPVKRSFLSRTLLALLCGIAAFIALGIWGEYATLKANYQKLESHLLQTAQAVGQHVDDSVELAELAIATIEAEIDENRNGEDRLVELRKVMRQQQQWADRLEGIVYIDKMGGIVVASTSPKISAINVSDRDYFIHHKNSVSLGTYIGPPIRNRVNGEWAISVSRRINGPNGSFEGVVLASIKLGHLLEFFSRFDVGADGSILLARGDGLVLARLPFPEKVLGNRMPADDPFVKILQDPDPHAQRFLSKVDGTVRLAASYQSPRSGVLIAASASEWEMIADWMARAKWRWMFGIFMVALACILTIRWRTQAELRAESEAKLHQRDEEFQLIAEASADLIEKLSMDGTRQYVSSSAQRILGRNPEDLVGTNIFKEIESAQARHAAEIWKKLEAGEAVSRVQYSMERLDGKVLWLDTSISPLKDPKGNVSGFVAITRDVTRQKAMQDELDILANTDALTGLANRRAFDIRFESLFREAEEEAKPLSLLMIDADCFKQYNDSYGHSAGDDCLKAIAAAVSGSLRATDLAARYGGEEIAILLPGTGEASAALVAEKIRRRIERLGIRHEANRPWGRVTISIGIGSFEGQALDPPLLFAKADSALYEAKRRGRNRTLLASTLSADSFASTG
ncbi:diguanylate cyclase [Rhizobium oryzicola]|uniref:diguanylate cyclase n=1 Tax=Rhizobium oryzicola TaxID=1232668 RepID=A0ABT8T0W7_9HYPH|nr:diguanylate cyclase [Rhizobium oryzicola]MDO1584400.1 diguanylate cyclase [Rhizobium oryzicola]